MPEEREMTIEELEKLSKKEKLTKEEISLAMNWMTKQMKIMLAEMQLEASRLWPEEHKITKH